MLTADLHKAEIKNGWSCTSSSPPWCLHNVNGDNCTFCAFFPQFSSSSSLLCHFLFPYSLFVPCSSSLFPSFILFYMVSVFKLTFFLPFITAICEAVRVRRLANRHYSSVHEHISQRITQYDEICFWNLDSVVKWIALVFWPVSVPCRITEIC